MIDPESRKTKLPPLIRRPAVWIIVVCSLILIQDLSAQVPRRKDPLRFLVWTASDARNLIPAISRIRPLDLAVAGGAIYASSHFDRTLMSRTERLGDGEFIRVIEEFGNIKAIQPMSLLIFLGSLMQRDERFQDAAFTSFEAVIFSNLMVNGLKAVFGRSRPWQNEGPESLVAFSGNTSFPSGHAAVVFAFVTPWVFFYPHTASYLLVGLGAGTAFSRVATGFHWFSDVVAGSTIGFATAYWLSKRHSGSVVPSRIAPFANLNQIGIHIRI